MAEWSFLTNHAVVLRQLAVNRRVTARELAQTIGITERTTFKILSDLERGGYISKQREGRRLCYTVNCSLSLRQRSIAQVPVGNLLSVLN
ncbi:MAG: MarR family transcriptional regulator [Chloroflexota bacterium]